MKLIRIVAVFITGLFILSAGSFVSSGSISLWSSWRGNVGRTCRIETSGHVRSLLVFDWKISIGNRFCVHPLTWNRKVFVGNSKNFYALDNSTGSIIWRYSGEYKTTHTPSFEQDKIFLTHHKGGVWNIISLAGNNGDLVKKRNMLSEPTFTLVHGGNLFYSIQRESGGKRYSQYYNHNMESGKINWFKRLPGEFTFDCMDDGILFIRNAVYEQGSQYPPGSIFALDEGDGDTLWELEPEKDSSFDGHLISKDGVLYVGEKNENGASVFAISAKTGELIWKYKSKSTIVTCKALSGENLVVADDTEGLFSLSRETGELIWSTGNTEMSDCQIVVTDELAYVCYPDSELAKTTNPKMESMLISLDIKSGEILSSHKFQHTPQAMAADENRIFITTEQGVLHCYKRKIALVGIVVNPTEISVNPGGGIQFDCFNYDMREKEIEGLEITWTVDPPALGRIDKNGFFIAGDGKISRGLVIARHGEILGSSLVFICNPPEIVFDNLDFGIIKKGETASGKVMFTTDLFCRGNLSVGNHPEWLSVGIPGLDPITEIMESEITVITENLEPGIYTGIVEFIKDLGILELKVTVEVVDSNQDVFSINRQNIDFGKLTAWDIENHEETFKITSLVTNIMGCGVSSNAEWLQLLPAYSKVDGSKEFEITCVSEKIKPGEKLSAVVAVKPYIGREVTFEVTVEKRANTTLVLQIDSQEAILDGAKITLDVPPQIISGRTMVPIRVISEGMGAEVSWDGSEKRIDITLTSLDGTKRVVKMWINKTTAEIDGESVTLDSPPTILSGRTLVPVRFISEAFGASVNWNQEERAVTIVYTPR